MVRKRSVRMRRRPKNSRPKTPASKTGWVIAELAKITGLPVRRLRYYVQHGLIRPQEIRGTATRYQRSELLRLLALPRVRTDKIWKMAALKRELDRIGEAELERLVLASPLTPAAAAALGVALPTASDGPNLEGPWGSGDAAELWHHLELLPGLVLMLSSRANVAVRNAAKKICDEIVG